jgi:hypothetical protein
MPIAFHTMHSLADRRVIFKTRTERVEAYHRALRIGARFDLGWFHLGTDHVHAVVFCPENAVARWAQSVEASWTLGVGLPIGFGRYHCKPVHDQGHLETLLGYVLRQDRRHERRFDPLHSGSNGPDLCGGRLTGAGPRTLVEQYLPRFGPRRIEELLLGRPSRPLHEFGPAPTGLVGPALERVLRSAAASAVGRADLRSTRGNVWAARRALLHLVRKHQLGQTVDERRMLGCSSRGLHRLSASPPEPAVRRAVDWQVSFHLTSMEEMPAVSSEFASRGRDSARA